MKTRRVLRVQNNRSSSYRSSLCRWLSEVSATLNQRYDARRLLCEQLERRYALHGMGFDGSFEHIESRDMRDEYSEGAVAQYASVRPASVQLNNRAEPESSAQWFSVDDATSNLATDTSEEAEVDCDHRRPLGGLRAEAEGGSSNWDRARGHESNNVLRVPLYPNPAQGNTSFDKPDDKPEVKLPAGSASNSKPAASFESKPTEIGLGQATSNIGGPASSSNKSFDPPATNGALNRSSGTTGALDMNTVTNTAINTATQLADRLGSAAAATASKTIFVLSIEGSISQNSSPRLNLEGKPAPSTDVSANRAAVTPSQSIVKIESNSATAQTATSLRATSNSVSTSVTASESSDDGWLIPSSALSSAQRTSRIADASSTSLSDKQTDGLLEQLRSVIDSLASERQTDSHDADFDSRMHVAIGNDSSYDFASAARRQPSSSDGMLELAAATSELSPMDVSTVGADVQMGNQHRSQLLASLELNREFELAGQTVDSWQSFVDPSTRVDVGQQAALATLQWFDGDATVDSSPTSAESEGSIWQNSLLPLSFLAVGGLLIRSRRRYVAKQNPGHH